MNKRRIQYGFAAFLLSVLNACGGVENFGAGMFGMGGAGGWRASDIVPSAPSIAIAAPSGGTTLDVATTVTISGTCDSDTVAMRVKYGGVVISDRSGVSQVQVSGTTWSFKWSPGKIRIGTQNLTAEGEKIGSPTGTSSSVSVTVSGIPLRTKCNTYLDADDLTYNDGDQVSTWTARVGTSGSGNAGATMEVDAWVAGAYGAQKSVRLTSASSGRIDVDALSSVISAGANQPLHVAILGQTIGATGSRTLFSGGLEFQLHAEVAVLAEHWRAKWAAGPQGQHHLNELR